MTDSGFLPAPSKGVRVVLPNGTTGTAHEPSPDGRRCWTVLDNGQSAWLERARLTPLDPDDQHRLDGRPAPPPPPTPRPQHPCGCYSDQSTIGDGDRHAAWHAEVEAQTGITRGPVDLDALRAARGGHVAGAGETYLDRKARATGKRASGALREASR